MDQVLFLLNLTVPVQHGLMSYVCASQILRVFTDLQGLSCSPERSHQPHKESDPFLKCSKKKSLYPVAGFRAFCADRSKTVKDIWVAFGHGKKK